MSTKSDGFSEHHQRHVRTTFQYIDKVLSEAEHRPLYEAIVLKARELQLAGATVLRGPMGFGKSSHLHTVKILRLSMDLPMVIEIVDTEEKVNAFLPVLDEMMGGGLVTLEKAKVIRYQGQAKR